MDYVHNMKWDIDNIKQFDISENQALSFQNTTMKDVNEKMEYFSYLFPDQEKIFTT